MVAGNFSYLLLAFLGGVYWVVVTLREGLVWVQ